MRELKAIVRRERLPLVLAELPAIPDTPGVTVSIVNGWGRVGPTTESESHFDATLMAKLEIVVADSVVEQVTDAIVRSARTGRPGDGKVFVSDVRTEITIRTGERTA